MVVYHQISLHQVCVYRMNIIVSINQIILGPGAYSSKTFIGDTRKHSLGARLESPLKSMMNMVN
jgi:hypothetical protein